ncbi:hypothetical protein GQ457_04G012100 [Hibiscus cannabinus]
MACIPLLCALYASVIIAFSHSFLLTLSSHLSLCHLGREIRQQNLYQPICKGPSTWKHDILDGILHVHIHLTIPKIAMLEKVFEYSTKERGKGLADLGCWPAKPWIYLAVAGDGGFSGDNAVEETKLVSDAPAPCVSEKGFAFYHDGGG